MSAESNSRPTSSAAEQGVFPSLPGELLPSQDIIFSGPSEKVTVSQRVIPEPREKPQEGPFIPSQMPHKFVDGSNERVWQVSAKNA